MLLMTDGTVMMQASGTNYWFSLKPNRRGSYVNGTWTQKASLPSNYGPTYYASAVLADGKLIMNGGEYNFGHLVESNLGAIYDPVADSWTPVLPPNGWGEIGDAQSAVLSDGTYMLGNCCSSVQALLDESSMTWTQIGAGKADANSEEGWTLLRNGDVLTVDITDVPNSEVYDPIKNMWRSAGLLPVNLIQSAEIGPQVLRPNGTVFVAGGNQHTAIYHSHTGAWSTGPDFPIVGGQQLDVTDGPGALLRNGTVLLPAGPGVYQPPSYFFIFNGTTFTQITAPPNAVNDPPYAVRLLMLPTGQVLEDDSSADIEIYTPGVRPDLAIAPAITSVATTLTHGNTYMISGVRFNGFSQANMYGDDVQMATNYPLVRITNDATGHVFYARTHNHSFMGVASQQTVSTMFDVPSGIETGASRLEVVANGISSPPVNVTIN